MEPLTVAANEESTVRIRGWKVADIQKAMAMIYRPDRDSLWDPSILWHDGRYYAFMMYDRDGVDGREANADIPALRAWETSL